MSLWVAVHGYKNKEKIDEVVLNRPIYELTERTNFLYDKINDIAGSGTWESLRLVDVVLDTTADSMPDIGDVVCVDPKTSRYVKALAGFSVSDIFVTSPQSYAFGILVKKSGNTGVVVTYGKVPLATNGVPWELDKLLEPGEEFISGPYYLSSTVAGKITRFPKGPIIYIGFFLEQQNNRGYGDIAIINPQYNSIKDAHAHKVYALAAQPAGTQEVTGTLPTDVHSIHGFLPKLVNYASDKQPRLVVFGSFNATSDVQYTIWLSNSSDPSENRLTSSPPTSWDHFLHWASSDAAEGTGVARVWSYNTVISIGTKGVKVSLENYEGADWDVPYYTDPAGPGDHPDKRTWIINVPNQTKGWLARYYRQCCTKHVSVDRKFSVLVFGGPCNISDKRMFDKITIRCGEIHQLTYTTNPSSGSLTIGSKVFTIGTDFQRGTSANETFLNLIASVLAFRDVLNCDISIHTSLQSLFITVPTGTTVSTTLNGTAVSKVADGAGDLSSGTVSMIVYDRYHSSLIDVSGYWSNIHYWDLITLNNNLQLMIVPYSESGESAIDNTVDIGDYWTCDIVDEAPGAYFVYSTGMHSGLSKYYPPIPFVNGVFVLNGVELESYDLYPNKAIYRIGQTGLAWYDNHYGKVPWPADWVDVDNPGSDEYQQTQKFYLTRMTVGDTGLVTSLKPVDGSPIKIVQCGTNNPSTVGDLQIDVDFDLKDDSSNLSGYLVYKAVQGSRLRKGPVVEQIIAGPGITVTQGANMPSGRGVVTISSGNYFSGDFEEVALENAKQELIGMFPYIKLLPWRTGSTNINSGFVAKFRIPHSFAYSNPVPKFKVVVYMTVFGESDIPYTVGGDKLYAGIDFSYCILPDFYPAHTNTNWPSGAAWNQLTKLTPDGLMATSNPIHADIPFGSVYNTEPIYKAYDPMIIHNNNAEPVADTHRKIVQVLGTPFPNRSELANWSFAEEPYAWPGSLIGIRIKRANVTSGYDEYTGAIGFINIRWLLQPV